MRRSHGLANLRFREAAGATDAIDQRDAADRDAPLIVL